MKNIPQNTEDEKMLVQLKLVRHLVASVDQDAIKLGLTRTAYITMILLNREKAVDMNGR